MNEKTIENRVAIIMFILCLGFLLAVYKGDPTSTGVNVLTFLTALTAFQVLKRLWNKK